MVSLICKPGLKGLFLVLLLMASVVSLGAQAASPQPDPAAKTAAASSSQAADTSPAPDASPSPQNESGAQSANAASAKDGWAPSNQGGTANVVVLEGDALRLVKARSVADLLREVAGVVIVENSGAFKAVLIRGSDPQDVVIILDGMRLYNTFVGSYDLSLIGVDQIERIEILRGSASAAYGPDAVGGVIYISTTKAKGSGLRVNIENRSYIPKIDLLSLFLNNTIDLTPLISGQHAGLAGSFDLGGVRLSVGGGFDRELGLFSYTDSTGALVYNQQSPGWGGNAGVGVDVPAGEGNIKVRVNGLARRVAQAGTISAPTPSATQDDTGLSGSIGWDTNYFLTKDLSFDGQIWGNWAEQIVPTYSVDLSSVGFDLKQTAQLSEMFSLGYGISGRYDYLYSGSLPTLVPFPDRWSGGIFLKPVLKTGILTMSPTIRLDLYSDLPLGLTASLDTNLGFSKNIGLWLSLASAYQVPSLLVQYVSSFPGYSSATPNTSLSGDLGLAITFDFLTSRSSIFVRDDQKTTIPNPGTISYEGLFYGFDQDFSVNIAFIRLGASYEYLSSYYLGNGFSLLDDKRVPGMPEHRLTARVAIKSATFELGVNGELRTQGFWDAANSQVMPAWFVLNANIGFWFNEVSNFYIAVDNLFNASYQVQQDYAMPGICIRIGLTLGF